MNVFEIFAKIGLDTSEYDRGLGEVDGKAKNFGDKLKKWGEIAGKVSTAMVGAATAASAAAIKVGSDFEASMSKVASISGATGEDLAALTAKAEEMGATTKFTASESAEALQYMAMAGWKTNDMLDGLSGVMNLAAASGENLGTVSDIVTDAMTAFGLSASDSGHFADVLAVASSNANTNVGLMGSTFKYVAPLAGALGFSIEDTASAIGLMANAGIKGEQAGTALRSMLTRLTNPPKEAASAMEELGISITNADGTMHSLQTIINSLRARFAGLSAEEKATAAATLAGQEAMSGLLAIVNASDTDFEKLSGAIKNADGAAAQMAETMQDNLRGQLTILGSALEALGIKAYKKFQEPLKNAVKSAIKEVEKLTKSVSTGKLSGSIDKLAKGFAKMVTVVSSGAAKIMPQIIRFAGAVVDNFDKLTAAVGAAAAAFIAFKTGMAIQSLVQGFQRAQVAISLLTLEVGKANLAQAALNGVMTIGQTAVALLTGKMSLAVLAQGAMAKAQAVLNAVMAANPIVLVTMAVVALAAAIGGLVIWYSRQKTEMDIMTEAIHEEKKAWDELRQTQQQQMKTNLAEIDNVARLWKELQTLVDENGKVIKSKERAKFITEEINKLAPDTIKWVNDERIAYEEGAKAVENLIAKKRAQIILEALEPQYKEAILKYQKKQNEQAEIALALADEQAKLDELVNNKQTMLQSARKHMIAEQEKNIQKLQRTYSENEKFLESYYKTIGNYENLSAAISANNYKVIDQYNRSVGQSYKTATNATKEELEKQVAITATNAELMKDRYKRGVSGVTEEMVRTAQSAAKAAEVEYERIGGNITKGIARGAEKNKGGLFQSISKICNDALDSAKKALKIKSPSRAFMWIGQMSGEGLAEGIEGSVRRVGGAASSLADGLLGAWQRDMPDLQANMSAGFAASVVRPAAGTAALSGSTINITINGAQYSDERALAARIAQEIQSISNRRNAYAPA